MRIDELREEIDRVDAELIPLLEKRFGLVAELLPYKVQLTDSKREREILARCESPSVQALYREVFRLSKELLRAQGFPSEW